jgi:hypothetical protein
MSAITGKCERCDKNAKLFDKKVVVLEGGNEGEIISVKICRKCDLDIQKGRDDTFAYPDEEEAEKS